MLGHFTEDDLLEMKMWLAHPAAEKFLKWVNMLIENNRKANFYFEHNDPIVEMKEKAKLKGQAVGLNKILQLKKQLEMEIEKIQKEKTGGKNG